MTLQLKTCWNPTDIRSRLSADGGVGFLFHATDMDTVKLAFEQLPDNHEQLWQIPPFIGSPIFWQNRVVGAHLISPLPAELWAGGHRGIRRFREAAMEPLMQLAQQSGLTHLGLAALLPFATNHGRYRPSNAASCVTTGHAATVAVIQQSVQRICGLAGVEPAEQRFAIFGAAGSIGSNTARWFVRRGLKDLRLIDVRARLPNVRALAEELNRQDPQLRLSVHAYEDLSALADFDIGVVATSAASPWMSVEVLSKAPVWIDDSHPRAATLPAERQLRGEVLYLECFVRGPREMSQTFPFRLPTPRDCYSCFAEVFVCWRAGMQQDFVIGPPSLDQIELMDELLPRYGFEPGPVTSKDGWEYEPADLAVPLARLRRKRPASTRPFRAAAD